MVCLFDDITSTVSRQLSWRLQNCELEMAEQMENGGAESGSGQFENTVTGFASGGWGGGGGGRGLNKSTNKPTRYGN